MNMGTIAEYLVKVFVISLILYSYYHFCLRNRLMHNWNRFFLLAVFFASIVIPFIELPAFFSAVQTLQLVIPVDFISNGTNIIFTAGAIRHNPITPQQAIMFIYVGICFLLALSLLISLLRLTRHIIHAGKTAGHSVVIVNSNLKNTPFSFFRYIFWNYEIEMNSTNGMQIMQHEMVHVRQLHSLDRLLVNMLMILFWINPVFWLVRKELFLVHEFIADDQSVKNKDADEFARMLLTAAFPVQYTTIANHFFTSPIKRRLFMLTQQQKTRFGYMSRLLALPVLLLLVAAFSIKDQLKPAAHPQPKMVRQEGGEKFAGTTQIVKDTVKASFPGGEAAWAKYISREVYKRIDSLQEAGKQGTAEVMFVVHEDGSLSDLKITKMEGTLLAQIVFDAIKNGPKWVPALSNAKRVRTIHKQPVTFQIQDEKEK